MENSLPRKQIVEELNRLRVYDERSMNSFSDTMLQAVLFAFRKTIDNIPTDQDQWGTPIDEMSLSSSPSDSDNPSKLTNADVKVLTFLATSKGRPSVLSISKKLHIPITTLQRKRKKLEREFFDTKCTLKYEKFGFRKAMLIITTNGKLRSREIGNRLLKEPMIFSVESVISENNANLISEVLFRSNPELLDVIERIKSFDGVETIKWIEAVEELGAKPNAMRKVLEN
jgi:DNA-binding Lrp family transcriptional regulator